MTTTGLGMFVALGGYGLAILGGCVLFQNAAADVSVGQVSPGMPRHAHNRIGFGLLTAGSTLQMAGTLISGFTSFS